MFHIINMLQYLDAAFRSALHPRNAAIEGCAAENSSSHCPTWPRHPGAAEVGQEAVHAAVGALILGHDRRPHIQAKPLQHHWRQPHTASVDEGPHSWKRPARSSLHTTCSTMRDMVCTRLAPRAG